MSHSQPTLENSGFFLTEQCDTPEENWLSEESAPSGEINPSDIPRENKVAVVRLWWNCVGASLEGRSDTGSGSELDLTSTSNSESVSDYMTAADLDLEELPALPMPAAPLKPPMGQVVQKQIPINLRRKDI